MIGKISPLLFSLILFGCFNLGEYNYQPIPKVKIQVVLKELTHNSSDSTKWNSLAFDYKITNNSQNQIYFQFDSIKVQFNGNVSSNIYYNSIASVIAKRKKLHSGDNEYSLYAVFPDSVKLRENNEFKILSYGFVK